MVCCTEEHNSGHCHIAPSDIKMGCRNTLEENREGRVLCAIDRVIRPQTSD